MTFTITIVPLVLAGIWLLMWAAQIVFKINDQIYTALMVIAAVLAGLGLIFIH